jgi:hypothetical protein
MDTAKVKRMPCKDLIQVVPAVTASRGSASDLRYRLLLAALQASAENVAQADMELAESLLASTPAKPARTRG